MVTIKNKGQAASGTYWITVQQEINGFILNGVVRCTKEIYEKKENVEGAELTLPKQVLDVVEWS